MTTTALALYQKMAEAVGQFVSGTTTSAGDTTSLISTDLCKYADDDPRIMESFALMTSGTYDGHERPISDFAQATGDCTLRYALAGAPGSGKTFVIHPWEVALMLQKLNRAIRETKYLFDWTPIATISSSDGRYWYDIPSAIIKKPYQIHISREVFSTEEIDDCETAWTAGTNVTASVDNRVFQTGEGSMKFVVAAGAAATAILGYVNFSSTDLSDHIGIKFAIKCSIATSAGDLQIHLSETANGASATETLDVPALVADEWQTVEVIYAGATTDRDALVSAALYQVTDIGACTIWLDRLDSIETNPAFDLDDMSKWDELFRWGYDEVNRKVYIPYSLPADRKLKFIGKRYVAASAMTAETDTVTADAPEVQHLVWLATYFIVLDDYFNASGVDKDRIEKDLNRLWFESEQSGRDLWSPHKTKQIPSWSYVS